MKSTSSKRRPQLRRPMVFERLTDRVVLTGLPQGVMPEDTGEVMLGDVHVTVVLMESNDQLSSVNNNSETWTESSITAVKQNVAEGLQWWRDALANLTDKHQLNFQIDYTYADAPVATRYEPITRKSTDFQFWMYDFLNDVGFNQSGNFSTDIRAFNHAQRLANDADWAFTIFVVNDQNDADGQFAPGGFSRAFAFSGGRFFVMPAGRPASTLAHETGHMFWARDEYFGGGTYSSLRGYYNTQNLNAADNPAPGFQQVPSIMETGDCVSGGGLLCTAYQTHTSSPSSLEMIGWKDSDGDGVFDLADVPHQLDGSGYYDASTETYHFVGTSSVQTLPNLNPSGLQNDITLNLISRAEFRIDAGPWLTAEVIEQPSAALDLAIPLPADAGTIEIRTVDATTGITSPVFSGTPHGLTATPQAGIQGFVWNDLDPDGVWASGEPGLAGWTIELVDGAGVPLDLGLVVEPDDFPSTGAVINSAVEGVTLSAIGNHAPSSSVTTILSPDASTGERVFGSANSSCGGVCTEWSPSRRLRLDFSEPISTVSIDAIGRRSNSYGRLEIYDATNNLLARTTTAKLGEGTQQTLTLGSDAGEIAYAVASGHAESTVLFDNLRIGPSARTTTDVQGAYSLPYLDDGEYNVRVLTGASLHPTLPDPAEATVTYVSGTTLVGVDFGFSVPHSQWQNANHRDVNNDGFVSPGDVLVIINDLNNNGPRALTDEVPPPYLDVNGDLNVTSADALAVINFLNAPAGSGEEPTALGRLDLEPADGAEGEFSARNTKTAASAALDPSHVLSSPADSPQINFARFGGDPSEEEPGHQDRPDRLSLAGLSEDLLDLLAGGLLAPDGRLWRIG